MNTIQRAASAVRGQIRFLGADPSKATNFEIEAACSEVAREFHETASKRQWSLFVKQVRNGGRI